MASPNDEVAAKSELTRRLGVWAATALVVGEVIGVGIFLTPADMARRLGSPFWVLVVWLVMGAAALAGAICLGSLSARFPEAGGVYAYLRNAYGRLPAFLFGWMSFLVIDPGLVASLVTGVAPYLSAIVVLSPTGKKLAAIGAIVVLAALNIIGMRIGAWILRGLTVLKLGLLFVLAAWGFGLGKGNWSNFLPFFAQRPGSDPLAGALIGGMILAFFSFGGWWDTSKVAAEVRNPAKTLPRALVLGVSIVTFVYILITAVFFYLVPLADVSSREAFAAQAGEALFGGVGRVVFSWVVLISVVGTLFAILMAAPRVYFAMARDGLFVPGLAVLHPRLGTPARAIAVQAVLASIAAAIGQFDQILGFFIAPMIVFLALVVAAVYRYGNAGDGDRVPRIPGYPVTPLVFIIPVIALIPLFVLKDPVQAGIGLGVLAAGVPVYWAISRRRS